MSIIRWRQLIMNIEHTDLNPTSHSQANSARQVEN